MRKFDFLVPHWKETSSEMKPLLDSIKIQRGIDLSEVGVIIAFDGPNATKLPIAEWQKEYPFSIEAIYAKKGGVSHTRNAALDASKAEYVMFCDADDCLMDIRGLYIVFREIGSKDDSGDGFDFLLCDFIEEIKQNEKIKYEPHVNNSTFVHSQVMRRAWMIENKIRFCDKLTIHEDSYFITLARTIAKPERTKWCRYPWYLWCWRDTSVCRHDDKYILKTYNNLLDSSDALINEFMTRGLLTDAQTYAVTIIWETYYTLNKPEWKEIGNIEYRKKVEIRAQEFLRKWYEYWDTMEPHTRMLISEGVRNRAILEGLIEEAKTPNAWVNDMIKNKIPKRKEKK